MFRHVFAGCTLFALLPMLAGAQAVEESRAETSREQRVFTDPDSGESYRVAPVSRVEGRYRFLDEDKTRVRLQFGLEAQVERLDQDNIWIRVYESKQRAPAPEPKTPPEPDVVPETTTGRLLWTPADAGLPQQGLWREGMAFGDFDGDGREELLLPPPRKARTLSASAPRIFRRDGDVWRLWSDASFPAQRYDYGDVATLDFDGDGLLDIALAMHLAGTQLFRGVGGGAFERVGGFPNGPTFYSRSIQTLNRGGQPLLLAFAEGMAGADPRALEGGGPQGANRGFRGWRFGPERVEPIDGDGAEIRSGFGDDFAVGDPTGRGETWIALASRRLRAREVLVRLADTDGVDPSPRFEAVALPLRHSSAYLGAVTFGDGDADGRDEIYFGSQTTNLDQQRTHLDRYRLDAGAESSWISDPVVSVPSKDGIWSLASGDLDGDGRQDVIAGTGSGELWVFLSGADGRLRRDLSVGLPEGRPSCVVRELEVRETEDAPPEVFALFAGEPVVDPTGIAAEGTGCEGGGRVAVWRVSVTDAESAVE